MRARRRVGLKARKAAKGPKKGKFTKHAKPLRAQRLFNKILHLAMQKGAKKVVLIKSTQSR